MPKTLRYGPAISRRKGAFFLFPGRLEGTRVAPPGVGKRRPSYHYKSQAWSGPHYLYSQFVVYNGLCLTMAPLVGHDMDLRALSLPVLVLGTVGFLWDHVAFKYGWWIYHAVTQIRIWLVPLDDFNFFFFAPTAAVSIYLAACRWFGLPAPERP